jgi:hypothetical protein
MPTKVEALAAAVRGTMPPEPSAPPTNVVVDPALRLYADSLAAALLGTVPPVATPPGVPGALTAAYPVPVPPTPGPHLAAASTGTLPSPADAVRCQIHVDVAGNAWVFNGTAWRQLQYAP